MKVSCLIDSFPDGRFFYYRSVLGERGVGRQCLAVSPSHVGYVCRARARTGGKQRRVLMLPYGISRLRFESSVILLSYTANIFTAGGMDGHLPVLGVRYLERTLVWFVATHKAVGSVGTKATTSEQGDGIGSADGLVHIEVQLHVARSNIMQAAVFVHRLEGVGRLSCSSDPMSGMACELRCRRLGPGRPCIVCRKGDEDERVVGFSSDVCTSLGANSISRTTSSWASLPKYLHVLRQVRIHIKR